MKTGVKFLVLAGTLGFLALRPATAGVLVTENVSPGATSWPGTPIINSVTNPAGQTSVGESFNGVGGCTNYTETFTITTTNYTLHTISIYAGGGSGTGSGTNVILRLFDLGAQTAPNPSPYSPGTDLFNSGSGLTVSYTPQTTGVLQFDFNGSDQVTLTNGHMYAFEIDGVFNSSPVVWQRTISDTYSGGAAYRNRSWINGNNARDFSLAVYGTAIGNTNAAVTNAFFGPNGVLFHGFTAPSGGINPDGANPAAGLIFSGGVLLGTTLNGGTQGAGTAFSVTLDGTNFNSFRSFASPPDAGNPQGDLLASGGPLFGTSTGGGNSGVGTVFLGQTNGVSVLRSFPAASANNATNSGGASPDGGLALSGNLLFGASTTGGAAANGTIFSLSTNTSTYSDLHDFSQLDSNTGTNADGAVPMGGLILSGGTLYGTASAGGAGGAGVVFSIGMNGGGFTTLYSFTPLDPLAATNVDGAFPFAGLCLTNGMLYGTTVAGGAGGKGVVFAVGTNGNGFTTLHAFSAPDPVTGTNLDGASPCAAVVIYSNVLYGTTAAGGTGASGTVFSLNPSGAGFHVLHSFAALNPITGTNTDGAQPVAEVLPLGNSLYGTTFSGGPGGVGTVFSVTIPYPPAIITNVVRNLDGSLTLSFLGGPNSSNVIQTAASLSPPILWQIVGTNAADANGAWQFTDPNPSGLARYYRSYVPAN